MKKQSIVRDLLLMCFAAVLLAFGYNTFSPKRIPLIRSVTEKVSVPDSVLFAGSKTGNNDASHSGGSSATSGDSTGIRVIAPLHERALAHPESVATGSLIGEKKEVFRIISLRQFSRLMKESRPLVFDARDSIAYTKGHVKGARNADGLRTDEYFERLVPIPKDTVVIIYCNNPDCHLGRMLADFMGAIGFTNLLLYDDGWDGWEKAHMPVDTVVVSW